MAPGNRQAVAPGNRQAMAPGNRQTIAPGNRQATAPGNRQDMAPGNRSAMAPGNRQMAPGNRQAMAAGNRQEMAPGNRQDRASRNRQDMDPRNRQDMAPGNRQDRDPRNRQDTDPRNRQDMAPGNRQDRDPRNRQDMDPRNRQDMAPGNRQDRDPRNRQDMAPGNRQDRASRNRQEMDPRNRQDVAPGNRQDRDPRNRQDVAPGNRQDRDPRNRQEMDPRNRQDVAPGNRQDRDPRNRQDDTDPRNRQDVAPGNRQDRDPRNRQDTDPRNRQAMPPSSRQDMPPGNRQDRDPRNRQDTDPRNRQAMPPSSRQDMPPGNRQAMAPGNRQAMPPENRQSMAPGNRSSTMPENRPATTRETRPSVVRGNGPALARGNKSSSMFGKRAYMAPRHYSSSLTSNVDMFNIRNPSMISTTSQKNTTIASLEQFVDMHKHDPNFPQDILIRARQFLEERRSVPLDGEIDIESAQFILDSFEDFKQLAIHSSPYREVRAVVDNVDDPLLPVGTFRALFIGTLFSILGTALQQLFSLRMPSINVSTYMVQVLSMPLGMAMARWMPAHEFSLAGWKFTLNPGPFNQKEHLLVVMMANVSFEGAASGAYVARIIQLLKLDRFYGERVLSANLPWQFITLLASQFIGYGCAGLTRRFLVYPPAMIWQKPLANMAVTKALFADEEQAETLPAVRGWSMTRLRFFLICFGAMFAWFWVPNYLFDGLALFNWPTWFSPGNVTLALIAGSTCGLGLNPVPTLDWNIAAHLKDPIVTPLFSLMNYAAGMAVVGFVAAPIMYMKNVGNAGYLPINSNKVYDNTAQPYDVRRILNDDLTINETAYRNYSVPWLSTTQVLNLAAAFAMYVALPIYIGLWYGRDIVKRLRSILKRQRREEQFNDVHNRLMSAYPECPGCWYLALLAISILLACLSVSQWPTDTPVWAIWVAVSFTLVLQIPVGMLAAMTNVEIPVSILSMVVGGYVLEGKVIPNLIFRMFSFMSTSQSLNFVSNLKIAHYAKIPPRCAFKAQVYATLIAGIVALGVNNWALDKIDGVCVEGQRQGFTCPQAHAHFSSSLLWFVVGPRRLFGNGGPYRAITYFIPLGVVLPVVVYLAARRWPMSWWRKVNVPIFLAGPMVFAPYNWSYMQGAVVIAIFFNFFVRRRYTAWWERYAYVMSGSFMTAIGIASLIIFLALQRRNIRLDWWGNTISHSGIDQGGWKDDQGQTIMGRGARVDAAFDLHAASEGRAMTLFRDIMIGCHIGLGLTGDLLRRHSDVKG
ncbi:hypothetical protein RJ55_07329 [Drechmeria coniospora]|nr:hypothetical protein RJ55_07329 [Drechmeria coniospora]